MLVEDELAERPPDARVAHARTMREALSALDSEVDCVLLDLSLPDAVGLDAVATLSSASLLEIRRTSRAVPMLLPNCACAAAAAPDRRTRETKCATVCHVDVSVRDLRNHTARVIAAVEGGEPVVLTVHGRPVADILPRSVRSERRPSELLVADLTAISHLASKLNVASDATNFDVGLTTEDMTA